VAGDYTIVLMITMRSGPVCTRVELPEVVDNRGRLMFAEVGAHVPFDIRRVFAIYGVPAGQERGAHAHRRTHQFIIMLSGSCIVEFEDGTMAGVESLDSPTQGLHVPQLVWIKLRDFSSAAVCLVLTSELYDAADYIRDLDEFKRVVCREAPPGRWTA
jgi:dTDP-4-dehydrorhamnose 3,5-epimerase-like enzyme